MKAKLVKLTIAESAAIPESLFIHVRNEHRRLVWFGVRAEHRAFFVQSFRTTAASERAHSIDLASLSAPATAAAWHAYNYARWRALLLARQVRRSTARGAIVRKFGEWLGAASALESRLVEINLPLARFVECRTAAGSIDRDEWRSEADSALLAAVRNFDITRGWRFATYGYIAIRNMLVRLRDRSRSLPTRSADALETMPANGDSLLDERIDLEAVLAAADLSEFEALVIRSRYGLPGGSLYSLGQVAANYSLPPDAIERVEKSALRKLAARFGCEELAPA